LVRPIRPQRRNGEDGQRCFCLAGMQPQSVHVQKQAQCQKRSALVAIDKGVILGETHAVGRSQFACIRVAVVSEFERAR
jgi:hypothetical protein